MTVASANPSSMATLPLIGFFADFAGVLPAGVTSAEDLASCDLLEDRLREVGRAWHALAIMIERDFCAIGVFDFEVGVERSDRLLERLAHEVPTDPPRVTALPRAS